VSQEGTSLLHGRVEMRAARRDDDHLRRPAENVLERNAHRVATLPAKRVEAAGVLDHLRHPVAATVDRVDPLAKEHAPPWRATELVGEPSKALVMLGDERFRNRLAAGGGRDLTQVLVDLPQG